MVSFEIKEKVNNQWHPIRIKTVSGKSLRELFQMWVGKDIVARFDFDGNLCFLCGNEYWRDTMAAKGPACTFAEGLSRLETSNPDLLAQNFTGLDLVEEIFPGSILNRVDQE